MRIVLVSADHQFVLGNFLAVSAPANVVSELSKVDLERFEELPKRPATPPRGAIYAYELPEWFPVTDEVTCREYAEWVSYVGSFAGQVTIH